jgi:uncharacterized protein (DUF983 family)
MLARALTLRCPWCGNRRSFLRGWFGKHERCRTCGLRWHREEGFELGAMTTNTILTFGLVVVLMAIGFVLTAPDIPVVPMMIGVGVVGVVAPLCFFPFSYMLWLVFDLAARPPEAAELAEAQKFVHSA